MVVGGVFYNVQVAHMKLCASRAFWLVAYPSRNPALWLVHRAQCLAERAVSFGVE